MAAKNASKWTTVSIKPMVGLLDVRSKPGDVVPGGFRYRQNFSTNKTGQLCNRDGFSKAFNGTPYTNFDHHHQGAARERITLLFESTDNSGVRRLFDGTQSRVSLLNETTGLWTDIVAGKGAAGTRFKAAELQDYVLFTNDYDEVFAYKLSDGSVVDPIIGLANAPSRDSSGNPEGGKSLTKAKVIIQYQGVIFLMNVFQDGTRHSSRVTWSDLNDPLTWLLSPSTSVAGFQDLDYGHEILAAAVMSGALYIYTSSSIWKIVANTDTSTTSSAFKFARVYSEPKNQSGCIVFPNTLASTGSDHYYLGREATYHYNQYLAEPERVDWILRADGAIFSKPDTAINVIYCSAPVAEYRSSQKEIWISWPSAGAVDENNWTLILNVDQKDADVADMGFTALVNYRPGLATGEVCNDVQKFIGASGVDRCLKEIGNGVFSREYSTITDSDLTIDLPLDNTAYYSISGYYRILRGTVPTGLYDREKLVRWITLELESVPQDHPCLIKTRVGNSRNLVDSNAVADECRVQWRDLIPLPLACIEPKTIPALSKLNQRPSVDYAFPCYEQGCFLYFEITITNPDGSPAIGGSACFSSISFDVMAEPKD